MASMGNSPKIVYPTSLYSSFCRLVQYSTYRSRGRREDRAQLGPLVLRVGPRDDVLPVVEVAVVLHERLDVTGRVNGLPRRGKRRRVGSRLKRLITLIGYTC